MDLVAVTVEILVFSLHIFQDKVRDGGLKLCARHWYEKRKVSAKCCHIGVLQRWPGHFSFGILPGNVDHETIPSSSLLYRVD